MSLTQLMQVMIDCFNETNMNSNYLTCLLRLIFFRHINNKDFAILGWAIKPYGNPKVMGMMALGI